MPYRAAGSYFATWREAPALEKIYSRTMSFREMEVLLETLKTQGVVDLEVFRSVPHGPMYGRYDGNPLPQFGGPPCGVLK